MALKKEPEMTPEEALPLGDELFKDRPTTSDNPKVNAIDDFLGTDEGDDELFAIEDMEAEFAAENGEEEE